MLTYPRAVSRNVIVQVWDVGNGDPLDSVDIMAMLGPGPSALAQFSSDGLGLILDNGTKSGRVELPSYRGPPSWPGRWPS